MADVSQLISYVSSYAFPASDHAIEMNLVCGVSLGGHAAWQCLFQEPRISAGISIIGCPDYTHLMEDRARLSKLETWRAGTFLGSKDFPVGLIDAIDRHDPAALTLQGICSLENSNEFFARESTADEKISLEMRLSKMIHGKRFLNMSGLDDKLVPYRCSDPFVSWLLRNVSGPSPCIECDFNIQNLLFTGIGHAFSSGMAREVDNFLIRVLSQAAVKSKSKTAKM